MDNFIAIIFLIFFQSAIVCTIWGSLYYFLGFQNLIYIMVLIYIFSVITHIVKSSFKMVKENIK